MPIWLYGACMSKPGCKWSGKPISKIRMIQSGSLQERWRCVYCVFTIWTHGRGRESKEAGCRGHQSGPTQHTGRSSTPCCIIWIWILFRVSEYFHQPPLCQRRPVQCVLGRHRGRWWLPLHCAVVPPNWCPSYQPTHQNWSLSPPLLSFLHETNNNIRVENFIVRILLTDLRGTVKESTNEDEKLRGGLVVAAVNQFGSGCSATLLLLHQPPAGRGDLPTTSVTSAHPYKIYQAVKTVASRWGRRSFAKTKRGSDVNNQVWLVVRRWDGGIVNNRGGPLTLSITSPNPAHV